MIGQVNYPVLIAAFAIYTLAIVAVGVYSSRYAKRSDEDYFLAGRSLGKWVAALSASASAESGWVTLGLVGIGFSKGIQAYWLVPGCLMGYSFIWFVLAGRMQQRASELSAVTVPDFFCRHFGERVPVLRLMSVLVILVAMLLYVASQFAAAGKAFETSFPNVEYQHGVLIGGAIVLAYTVSGGFRAVCWTDFAQALIMAAALVGFPIYLLVEQGGYGSILNRLGAIDGGALTTFVPDLKGFAFVGFLFGAYGLGINFGYAGQPHVVIRFMALRNRRDATLGGLIAVAWVGLVLWGAVTIGIIARVMAEGGAEWGALVREDSEVSLVVSAMHLLPEVLSGVVLAAVLAAICSTADSQLVVAASAVANDIYARMFARDGKAGHLLLNRAVVLLLGVGAVLLVIDEKVQVYQFVLTYGWAILGAAFGPQLILALFWRRATHAGCVAGMAVGFVVPIAWQLSYDAAKTGVEIYNLPLGFVCAGAVNIVVSWMTKNDHGRVSGSGS